MADTTKLKKGTPPQRLKAQETILEDTRPEEGKKQTSPTYDLSRYFSGIQRQSRNTIRL